MIDELVDQSFSNYEIISFVDWIIIEIAMNHEKMW